MAINLLQKKYFILCLVIVFLLFSCVQSFAADTGWHSPGTMENIPYDPNTYRDWTLVDRAKTQDDQYAQMEYFLYLEHTNLLRATNFGFSIPAGSTINGIEIDYDAWCYAIEGHVVDPAELYIVYDGSQEGNNKASSAGRFHPTDTDVYIKYGSSVDLWGVTLNTAKVNDSTFGWEMNIYSVAAGGGASVDHMRMKIYYTEPTGPASISKVYGIESSAITKKYGVNWSDIAKIYGIE